METFGEKIFNLRKEKNVSQEALAFELGVARQTVSKWEMDATQPTLENVEGMCKFFGVNAAYFFESGEAMAANVEIKQTPVAVETKEDKYKTFKTVLMVVGAVSLIICIIFGAIAFYDIAAPAEGEIGFTFIATTCIFVGIIVAAILITLLVLFIKKRKKNRQNKDMLISSDKM